MEPPKAWPHEPVNGAVPLREYIEALFEEQRKAIATAEQEREKSAQVVRDSLAERVQAGDSALKSHVDAQIASVQAALVAQEKFATEVQRAQKEAVGKAFQAATELAAKHNDLIRAAEKRDEIYATDADLKHATQRVEDNKVEYLARFARVENFQARLMGGLAVVAAVGVANFVRIWAG